MITCKELIDFLADYLAGELPHEEEEAFEEHLAVCPPCIHYLESYRRTIDLERDAFLGETGGEPGQAPPPMPDDLIRAILESRKKPKS